LKEGKAININIIAGVIVHINSIKVPWFKYFCDISVLFDAKFLIIENNIHPTPNNINTK
jgi:hypothetical protein